MVFMFTAEMIICPNSQGPGIQTGYRPYHIHDLHILCMSCNFKYHPQAAQKTDGYRKKCNGFHDLNKRVNYLKITWSLLQKSSRFKLLYFK